MCDYSVLAIICLRLLLGGVTGRGGLTGEPLDPGVVWLLLLRLLEVVLGLLLAAWALQPPHQAPEEELEAEAPMMDEHPRGRGSPSVQPSSQLLPACLL